MVLPCVYTGPAELAERFPKACQNVIHKTFHKEQRYDAPSNWGKKVKCTFFFFSLVLLFKNFFPFLSRSTPVDKWFHVAAVWDSNASEAQLFLDGEKVGTQAQSSGSNPVKSFRSVYDIGIMRISGQVLRGYLRDLMIVGRALTGEELTNITGKSKCLALELFSLIPSTPLHIYANTRKLENYMLWKNFFTGNGLL